MTEYAPNPEQFESEAESVERIGNISERLGVVIEVLGFEESGVIAEARTELIGQQNLTASLTVTMPIIVRYWWRISQR